MLRELWVLGAVALITAPAAATTVTVQMSGTLTGVSGHTEVLDGSVSVGGGFSLTLTYDDALPDQSSPDCCGTYTSSTASVAGVTGNYSFSSTDILFFFVRNDDGGADRIDVDALGGATASGPFPPGVFADDTGLLRISLVDSSQSALDSDALVDVNWNLADYDGATFSTQWVIQPVFQPLDIFGQITSIQVIPEPSTALLVALGLVAVAVRRSALR